MSSGPRKKSGAGKYVLLIILLLLVFACTSAAMYIQNIGYAFKPNDGSYTQVKIPKGTTAAGVAGILEEKGIIRRSMEFSIYSRLHGYSSKYQAGTYALSPSMDMQKLSGILASGKVNSVRFQVTEGDTEYDIADKLAEENLVKRKKFVKALESGKFKGAYPFLAKIKGKHMLEGYLAAKTYQIPAGSDPDEIIRLMLDQHGNVFGPEEKALAFRNKRSQHEIMIIASIIEKECGNNADRRKVASVIYNRLKKKMHLQMDSTVQYALSLNGERKEAYAITNNDTRIDSPYNTYRYKGLPAGPICSPGPESIKAALRPAKTGYLYFVNSEKLDGSMNFSKKYSKFMKDKEAYYNAVQNQQ